MALVIDSILKKIILNIVVLTSDIKGEYVYPVNVYGICLYSISFVFYTNILYILILEKFLKMKRDILYSADRIYY